MSIVHGAICTSCLAALSAIACGSSDGSGAPASADAGSGGNSTASGGGAGVSGNAGATNSGGAQSSGGASGTGGSAPGGSGGLGGSSAGGRGGTDGGTTGGSGGGGPAPIVGVRIFYTDLLSGPNTGGENGAGAYVTVFGNSFGATRGASTVTVGGGGAAAYPIWTNTRVTVQLGATAKTGDIVVNVDGTGASNGAPFTVRAGSIYFVSGAGSDTGNDGSFGKPWGTILHAKDSLKPGDIAYVGTSASDSVSQTTESNYRAALSMEFSDGANSGTADAPKALIVYPGATATIGVESGLERGLLAPAITGTFDFWVIAGFTIRGETEAIDLEGPADGWRIVGNDISCPNGTGLSGCVTGGPTHLAFLGNVVHDAAGNVAASAITKYYHGIYFGSSHIELGWNVVRDGKTCRAIQFHDTGGPNEFDLDVHDNLVHGTTCDGINFATVDPSQGAVRAYNNVVYDVGRGPDPVDGSSNYAGVYVANITNAGPAGSGSVQIYQNTFYDVGARATGAAGAIARAAGPVGLQADNNLVLSKSGEQYVSSDTDLSMVQGSHNLFFGAGTGPAELGPLPAQDPLFVNATTFDFHLKPASPAIDHGMTTAATTDFDGTPRPQGAAFDVGAYEAVP
jgi:hypothetical protein